MEILDVDVPTPVVASLVFFVFMTLLILDSGAGTDIFYPLARPSFRSQVQAMAARHEKLKSKYL